MMERFIVGTGRCGSTLLSTMVNFHPDVLVLSEFFATLDRPACFSDDEISGAAFAEFLARVNPTVPISFRGPVRQEEVVLEQPVPTELSTLLLITLPTFSDEPHKLFAEVMDVVATFPTQRYVDHYNALFGWLMRRLDKVCWVERSGPSAEYLPELVNLYPEARFVHLHRDGPETAASMMNHPYFQLVTSFCFDPPTDDEIEAGPSALGRRLSPDYLSPRKYADFWSYELIMCYRGLAELDRDQYINVRYEDLIAEPIRVLEQISGFLELPERDGWIDRAAAIVKARSRSGLDALPPDVREELIAGCETGQLLLGRLASDCFVPTFKRLRQRQDSWTTM